MTKNEIPPNNREKKKIFETVPVKKDLINLYIYNIINKNKINLDISNITNKNETKAKKTPNNRIEEPLSIQRLLSCFSCCKE